MRPMCSDRGLASSRQAVRGLLATGVTLPLLIDRISGAQEEVLVAAPYISAPVVAGALGALRVPARVLTALDARAIQAGSLSLPAVAALLRVGVGVRSIPNLHAKLFVVDSTWALVGSGNFTAG